MFGGFRRILPWIATSIISILLILATQDQVKAPLYDQVSGLVTMGAYPVSSSIKFITLFAENRKLRYELAKRNLDNSRASELSRENARLRELLDYKSASHFDLLPAEVVGSSSDAGITGLLIDRGYHDGITTGQAVMAPEGLVGRVFRVNGDNSIVQLVGDPNLGIAAKMVHAQESGIIHSAGLGRLRLDGVPTSTAADIGDSVVTSGQGGVFPPGILIGFTTKISPSNEGWLLTVSVDPCVDLHRVEEVFIVRTAVFGE